MKIIQLSIISLFWTTLVSGQTPRQDSAQAYHGFADLIRASRAWYRDTTAQLPIIYRSRFPQWQSNGYREPITRLAAQTLGWQTKQLHLQNPFGRKRLPLAGSVVFQGHLVVLFSPGKFACYRLEDFSRNLTLEQQLNTRRFTQQWVYDSQLIGQIDNRQYVFNPAHGWQETGTVTRLKLQPKLFEDEHYAVYRTCAGEFGGGAIFLDKRTDSLHVVTATCPVAVWKHGTNYMVLSSLTHATGSTALISVADPARLPTQPLQSLHWDQSIKPSMRNDLPTSPQFAFVGVTTSGGFTWRGQTLFLVNQRPATFFATVTTDTITVVEPFFPLFYDWSRTTVYGVETALINMFTYTENPREIDCIVVHGLQATMIDWKKRR